MTEVSSQPDRAAVAETTLFDVAIVGAGYVGLPLAQVFTEAGKRVLPRKPVELNLRLAHLGQVGGKSTETEEAADFVMNRPAGQRPPDLVLGLGSDDQVLEGNVRG